MRYNCAILHTHTHTHTHTTNKQNPVLIAPNKYLQKHKIRKMRKNVSDMK